MIIDPGNSPHFRHAKVCTPKQAMLRADQSHVLHHRTVTTNGSFDPLHIWHVYLLEQAKRLGDCLFVGVDSDASLAAKGDGRPRAPQYERALMVASLQCVDWVVLLRGQRDEEPVKSLLGRVAPAIHVNSAEYGPPESWLEWPAMCRIGIKGVAIPRGGE